MFKQQSKNWWEQAVFYELYADKFAGDLKGLKNKLPYLENLGINCIHILPHYPSPMTDDGYDVADYMNVRRALGTLKDFENFVSAARKKGINIMVDFVLNHTSIQHPWFQEAGSSLSNPKRDFYIWSKTGKEFQGSINAFAGIKPSVWVSSAVGNDFYYSTFYPEQADLNWRNPEVFSEMMKVVDFWAEMGVRGFRLDAVSHLIKKEGTSSKGLQETHNVIKKIRSYIDAKWEDVVLLAEVHDAPQKNLAYFGAGDECQLVYNFPLAEELFLASITGEEKRLWNFMSHNVPPPKHCCWLGFLRNHDDLSLVTLSSEDKKRLLGQIDQERKFSFGDGVSVRLATAVKKDKSKIEKAFSLLFGVAEKYPIRPMIYYGDEIGMENEAVSAGEKDTRRAVRGKFDWPEAERQMSNPNSLIHTISKMISENNN